MIKHDEKVAVHARDRGDWYPGYQHAEVELEIVEEGDLDVLERRQPEEVPNWPQHQIASTNQHPISTVTEKEWN